MVDIVSITPNPAVDLSASGDKILPVAKLRGTSERHDPRGGGINIARVIKRLFAIFSSRIDGGDPVRPKSLQLMTWRHRQNQHAGGKYRMQGPHIRTGCCCRRRWTSAGFDP